MARIPNKSTKGKLSHRKTRSQQPNKPNKTSKVKKSTKQKVDWNQKKKDNLQEMKELLFDHIEEKYPGLLDSSEDAVIHPQTHQPYYWVLNNSYSLPEKVATSKRRGIHKLLSDFSKEDREDLREALENGNMMVKKKGGDEPESEDEEGKQNIENEKRKEKLLELEDSVEDLRESLKEVQETTNKKDKQISLLRGWIKDLKEKVEAKDLRIKELEELVERMQNSANADKNLDEEEKRQKNDNPNGEVEKGDGDLEIEKIVKKVDLHGGRKRVLEENKIEGDGKRQKIDGSEEVGRAVEGEGPFLDTAYGYKFFSTVGEAPLGNCGYIAICKQLGRPELLPTFGEGEENEEVMEKEEKRINRALRDRLVAHLEANKEFYSSVEGRDLCHFERDMDFEKLKSSIQNINNEPDGFEGPERGRGKWRGRGRVGRGKAGKRASRANKKGGIVPVEFWYKGGTCSQLIANCFKVFVVEFQDEDTVAAAVYAPVTMSSEEKMEELIAARIPIVGIVHSFMGEDGHWDGVHVEWEEQEMREWLCKGFEKEKMYAMKMWSNSTGKVTLV
ncbi:hypothetical protein BJ508DRAFT_327525 [Ascobolus immersus RN42]|uniref:Uncharacterized protein n=1 Tax=Ascobolus immersus RN42 TaxID=1160509 RepID=A0A3N4I288_ASCIM|nr:hypothetical protein BJ508DRAFT_327525 [Ascobolus immersus RN42]